MKALSYEERGARKHPALVTVADFLAVQGRKATPTTTQHTYRLTGLLACAVCGRRMEGAWSHGNPAYRCRHGKTIATAPDTDTAGNAFIREHDILARLPLLHQLMTGTPHTVAGRTEPTAARAATNTKPSTNTATITPSTTVHPEEVIDELRRRALVLSYDPRTRTLEANSTPPARVTV